MSAPKSKATQEAHDSARVSDISAFKKRKGGSILELPSGLVMRCQRVELQTFLLQGNVPNPLMEIISEALEKGQKAEVSKIVGVDEGKIDLNMVNDMYETVNAVVQQVALEPKVHPKPASEDDRRDDQLYVDELDDEDKMFLFQWATGGTSDLATFREEARAGLDAVAEGSRRPHTAKHSSGAKKR